MDSVSKTQFGVNCRVLKMNLFLCLTFKIRYIKIELFFDEIIQSVIRFIIHKKSTSPKIVLITANDPHKAINIGSKVKVLNL